MHKPEIQRSALRILWKPLVAIAIIIYVAVLMAFAIWRPLERQVAGPGPGKVEVWYRAEFTFISVDDNRPIERLGDLSFPHPQILVDPRDGIGIWRRYEFEYTLDFVLGPGMEQPKHSRVSFMRGPEEQYRPVLIFSARDHIHPGTTVILQTRFWVYENELDNLTMFLRDENFPESVDFASFASQRAGRDLTFEASAKIEWGIVRDNRRVTIERQVIPPTIDSPWWRQQGTFERYEITSYTESRNREKRMG